MEVFQRTAIIFQEDSGRRSLLPEQHIEIKEGLLFWMNRTSRTGFRMAEAQLYKDFAEITGDKTTLLISHRLGITSVVDRILVFRDGN